MEDEEIEFTTYTGDANSDPECRANTHAWTSLMGVVEEAEGTLTQEKLAVCILNAVYEVLHETCGLSHENIMAVVDETYGRGVSPE